MARSQRDPPPTSPAPQPLKEHFTQGRLQSVGPLPQLSGEGSRVPPPHIPVPSVWGSTGLPLPVLLPLSSPLLGWEAPHPRAAPSFPRDGLGRTGSPGLGTSFSSSGQVLCHP